MAFWKKIFKSKYTGAEIDAAVAKAGDATKVVANPTLAGTEAALEGLQVGDTKYRVYDVVPTITLTQTDIASILQSMITFFAGANDKIQRKIFSLTSSESGSVYEKCQAVLSRPNKDCFIAIEGFNTVYHGYSFYDGAHNNITTDSRIMGMLTPVQFADVISFIIELESATSVKISAIAQKSNIVA